MTSKFCLKLIQKVLLVIVLALAVLDHRLVVVLAEVLHHPLQVKVAMVVTYLGTMTRTQNLKILLSTVRILNQATHLITILIQRDLLTILIYQKTTKIC